MTEYSYNEDKGFSLNLETKMDGSKTNEELLELDDTKLIHQFTPLVNKLCLEANKNVVCAFEDLRQEGYIAVLKARRNYDPKYGSTLFTWIYRNVHDAIANYQKNNLSSLSGTDYINQKMKNIEDEKKTLSDILNENLTVQSYTNVSFDEEAENYLGTEELEDKLKFFEWADCLSRDQKYVLDLRYGLSGNKLTIKEISDVTGKSIRAVNYLIKTAKQSIRRTPGIMDYLYD